MITNFNLEKGILLFTGGLKSLLMLDKYQDSIECILVFRMGAGSDVMIQDSCSYYAKKYEKQYLVKDLEGIVDSYSMYPVGDCCVMRKVAVSDSENMESCNVESVPVNYPSIPFINMIMISIGISYCEGRGFKNLFTGYTGYDKMDCLYSGIDAMSKISQIGTSSKVKIMPFYLELFRTDTIQSFVDYIESNNVDIERVNSCDHLMNNPCTICKKCKALTSIKSQLKYSEMVA